ncbi:MAG: hypothetical protein ACKVZJ_08425 [Phycisphaerales bacterium]
MCDDPSVTYLNKFGYNVVRLPREGIEPFQVIRRSGEGFATLGTLNQLVILPAGTALPSIKRDEVAANIQGQKTQKFDFNVGIKLLEKLLQAMGVGSFGFEAAFNRDCKVEFVLEGVLCDSVVPAEVANVLKWATPDLSSMLFDSLDDKDKSYLVTQTLKSRSFTVKSTRSDGSSAAIDVGAIQQVLGINAKVSASSSSSDTVSFAGERALRFGFQAFVFWIEMRNGSARFRFSPPDGPIGPMMVSDLANDDQPSVVLLGQRELVRLR